MSETTNNGDLFDATGEHKGASEEFLIVGLGASAGGIRALKEFFAQVPATSGMAYVVILHLSPDHESRLAEVLQSTATIPVTQVVERVKVKPDHVYVISPNQSLAMVDGHLALSKMTRIEERRAPVDIFFRTLAESHHSRAVCVVLSGTGANGSMGIKRVKEYGGICIVQEPTEAEHSEMPRNSIATGLVDYVLPVAQIPAKIIAYKNHLGSVNIPVEPQARAEIDDQALRDIFMQLRTRTGHDFTNYKRSTVLRRIKRRISVHELSDLPAYARYLHEQPDETRALLKDLLISVTNFFRDPEAFDALERDIIPRLFENKGPEDQVRVWVAGCATGEEAYTVAMLLAEHTAGSIDAPSVQVFATDIDEWAISKAREGLYTLNDAADVSPERLQRFFIKEGDGYRVRREIREMVLFAVHNLIKDPPFSQLDLITCRNLLIYLNRAAQGRVMQVFHFALNPQGFLFLGRSESIEGANDLFVTADKEHHIFQGRPVETRLPLSLAALSLTSQVLKSTEVRAPEVRLRERFSYMDLHQRLLEQYAPPSVVVNENYDIVHLSERAGRYMQITGGEPSYNLLKLIRPELRLGLRTALYQATRKRERVATRGLEIGIDGRRERLNLIVHPVMREETVMRGLILVLFEEARAEGGEGPHSPSVASPAEPIARQLEDELVQVRTQLHATSEQHELQQEELKASNEELQAMNEELRSTAEELETSREEMQSLNEELTTVNQELKIKIEEITQTSSDFQNLIHSTDIATIFLDRKLRIQLFTPRTRDIFNLIPADVGRSLSDITSHLQDADLMADIGHVLDRLQTIERVVLSDDGRAYAMRALPYRTTDDHIGGVVLTFSDITERRRADISLRETQAKLELALEAAQMGVWDVDLTTGVAQTNLRHDQIFGYTEAVAAWGIDIFRQHLLPEDLGKFEQAFAQALDKGVLDLQLRVRWPDGSLHWIYDRGHVYYDERRRPLHMTGVTLDITARKMVEEELQHTRDESERRLRAHSDELAEANEALRRDAIVHQQVEAMRGELLRKLVTAQEVERRNIARDLHDQLGQHLTALRLNLEILKARMVEDARAFEQIEQTQTIARRIESDIDFLAWELRPLTLDDLGLAAAINDYVQRWSKHTGILTDYHTGGLDRSRLAPEIETNVYRILQEALNNVQKHAQASRVDVILERRDSHVVLIVEDDGVGGGTSPTPSALSGMGIVGMSERAALLGGTLEIESEPGEGMTIFVRVPASFVEEN